MKHLSKNILGLLILTTVIIWFTGCEQDPQLKKYVYPMPQVTGMSPNIGYVTSQVVITGTDFGDQPKAVKIFFGGVQATDIVMCKNNRIAVKVPENATSGEVTLQVWTNEVGTIGQYTVLPTPYVESMQSDNNTGTGIAEPGNKITIKGENFGNDPSVVSISFNGTPAADFNLIDDKTIEAITPEDYSTGNVIVTIRGYEITGSVMFNPNTKGDVTVAYLKNYKQPFIGSGTGDWTDPDDWNQSVKNPTGCLQTQNGTTFLCFQSGWGKDKLDNARVWQATTLRAGSYRLEVTYAGTYVPNSDGNGIAAALVKGTDGNSIPDVDKVSAMTPENGVFATFSDWGTGEAAGTLKTSTFTLDDATDIVIGFVVTIKSSNTYFKVTNVKLILE